MGFRVDICDVWHLLVELDAPSIESDVVSLLPVLGGILKKNKRSDAVR